MASFGEWGENSKKKVEIPNYWFSGINAAFLFVEEDTRHYFDCQLILLTSSSPPLHAKLMSFSFNLSLSSNLCSHFFLLCYARTPKTSHSSRTCTRHFNKEKSKINISRAICIIRRSTQKSFTFRSLGENFFPIYLREYFESLGMVRCADI